MKICLSSLYTVSQMSEVVVPACEGFPLLGLCVVSRLLLAERLPSPGCLRAAVRNSGNTSGNGCTEMNEVISWREKDWGENFSKHFLQI